MIYLKTIQCGLSQYQELFANDKMVDRFPGIIYVVHWKYKTNNKL